MSLALAMFSGCLLFLDRRTEEQKVSIEYHNVHSSKLDALLIFQCYASSMLFIHTLTFVVLRTEEEYAFFFFRSYKNVFYKVNISFACLMNI